MPRANASATIAFGLVSIPIKVYTAASSESVKMHYLTPDGHRVNQLWVDAVSGEKVERSDFVLGYEVARDQCVPFSKDDLAALEPASSVLIDLVSFVPAGCIYPVSVENCYYLGPYKGSDRAYTLLCETMRAQGVVGVGQWANRGKEKLVTVHPYRGGLRLDIMFYASEVRAWSEVEAGVAKHVITDEERELSNMLVAHLARDTYDASQYRDTYAERVRQAAQAKAEGQGITFATVAAPSPTNVFDLIARLKASVEKPGTAKAPADEAPMIVSATPAPAPAFALAQPTAPKKRSRRAS